MKKVLASSQQGKNEAYVCRGFIFPLRYNVNSWTNEMIYHICIIFFSLLIPHQARFCSPGIDMEAISLSFGNCHTGIMILIYITDKGREKMW